MLRLVAYAPNGVRRYAVDRREMLLGSAEGCDVRLPYAGVGPRHAALYSEQGAVRIEDLGSRKGVLVNGERVRDMRLQVLDEIRLGSITLLLEDVVQDEDAAAEPAAEPAPEPTITPPRMLEHLARVSAWVLSDTMSANTTLEAPILDLLRDFGGGALFLFQGETKKRGIKFVVATDARWLGNGAELLKQITDSATETGEVTVTGGAAAAIVGRLEGYEAWIAFRSVRALDRSYLFVVALPRFRPDGWSPLPALRTLADQLILGLVHHVGQYEPILFGSPQQAEVTLAPGLIVGESEAMKQALTQLRAAVDQEIHVLIRGEPGVTKELWARSIHLSGRRRERPFVKASCAGAGARQIEADLFGAEVAGSRETVVREGKLLAADGGSLYLEDVEQMPLPVQARLVRFLRSGEVEPVDSLKKHPVDVRLIVSSADALETWAGRDKFRIDLAYRLSQVSIDVPPLRERREDLPLLIQSVLNRCCHDTGKRVQGITVQALEALVFHDYPGNLPELENIVRRLVYLCRPGQPIDQSMLPEEVRLSKVKGPRPEGTSELTLEKLVSECERAAIREALRRSLGNKSEAARLLGLSRNGLTMKITRLGL
jgi:DNA-binding NtrC family response regulator/pSer/pThr/pTyr-binding forkhead associated (FHA) protein